MRNLKRVLSLALATIMLLGMMVMGTGAANVSDFNDSDQIGNVEAASIVTGLGIFVGDTSGNFDPQRPVTRAEMATIICKILYGSNVNGDNFKGTGTFADAKTYQGGWAEGYINMCQSQGIVNGYNATTFGAADTVTTWQAALMLQRALGYWNTAAGETISELTVTGKAANLGLYGDLTLSVDAPLTREDVAVLVFNTLFAQRVHYDDVRGLYTKDNDRNVVVNNGTNDEMNTLAQNTFGLYSVEGLVTENGYTNINLTGKTKVLFDDEKDVTGDKKVEVGYTFDFETDLDFIGHAVTVYYRIDRKAPSVYTIVDQAEKVEIATVSSNFSTTVRNAGFSRDTSDTQIVYNYDLDNAVDFKDYSNKPVILISNSSDLTVDYAIIVEQELDYVTRVRVNTADRDNPITTYSMNVLGNKSDDTNAVALGAIDEDQYVITVKIAGRGSNDSDLYVIKAAETEQEIITKVTRRLNTTTGLASAGVDYKESAVGVHTDLKGLTENAITPYADVESRGEYTLVFDDFFRNLIGVYELSGERVVNYAYVAQFGHKINTEGSLNDKYALTAHIYFADGTNGVYTVDTGWSSADNAFRGRVDNNYETWVPYDTDESKVSGGIGTGIGSDGEDIVINQEANGLNQVDTYSSNKGVYSTSGNSPYGKIGLYNVTITDSGKARISTITSTSVDGTSATAADVTTIKTGVTYMADDLYGNSNSVFFLVHGKYDESAGDKGLTVKVITGMAGLPSVTVEALGSLTAPNESDDGTVGQLYTTAKTGYNAVDAALIAGYKAEAELGDTVYFYDGRYTITKNNGKWDLDVQVYNASTGESEIISYSGYNSDEAARKKVRDMETGYYVDGGSKDNVLSAVALAAGSNNVADTGTGLATRTEAGNRYYTVDASFEYFTKQGDILTLYTDKNTKAYGVIASEAEIADLTGNHITSLQELSDLIESRKEVWEDNNKTPAQTSADISFSYGKTNNKVDIIFITDVIPAYDKDYTGTKPTETEGKVWVDYADRSDLKVFSDQATFTDEDALSAILADLESKYGEENVSVAAAPNTPANMIYTVKNGKITYSYTYQMDNSNATANAVFFKENEVDKAQATTGYSVTANTYALYRAKSTDPWTPVAGTGAASDVTLTDGTEIKTGYLQLGAVKNKTTTTENDYTKLLDGLIKVDTDYYVLADSAVSVNAAVTDKGTGLVVDPDGGTPAYAAYQGLKWSTLHDSSGVVKDIDLGYVSVGAFNLGTATAGGLTIAKGTAAAAGKYAAVGAEISYQVTVTGTISADVTITFTGATFESGDVVNIASSDSPAASYEAKIKVGNTNIDAVTAEIALKPAG